MTEPLPNRRDVVARLLRDRGRMLVVPGLGGTTWDVAAAGDSELDFYLWGGMGSAAMIGLGLALAQSERPVLVVTGDGEQLMGLGALATIGVEGPANLSVVVIDNEHYGETGMQPTHTGRGVDLAAIAAGAGFAETATITDLAGVDALWPRLHAGEGPLFATVKVDMTPAPMVLPSRDGPWIKHRFRRALLGNDAV
jgi:thiamine pyrophosphate-dependent acetolactate synthase large subunit-like protein